MTVPYLPYDVVNEIVAAVGLNKSSLHACSLVSRTWSELALPRLWSAPSELMRSGALGVIDAYVSCLPDASKAQLREAGLILPRVNKPRPSRNYASFLKVLGTYFFDGSARMWFYAKVLKRRGDSTRLIYVKHPLPRGPRVGQLELLKSELVKLVFKNARLERIDHCIHGENATATHIKDCIVRLPEAHNCLRNLRVLTWTDDHGMWHGLSDCATRLVDLNICIGSDGTGIGAFLTRQTALKRLKLAWISYHALELKGNISGALEAVGHRLAELQVPACTPFLFAALHCRNLVRLAVEWDGPISDGAATRLTTAAYEQGPAWPALTYLRFDHSYRWSGNPEALPCFLMHAPSLETLSVRWCHEYRSLATHVGDRLRNLDAVIHWADHVDGLMEFLHECTCLRILMVYFTSFHMYALRRLLDGVPPTLRVLALLDDTTRHGSFHYDELAALRRRKFADDSDDLFLYVALQRQWSSTQECQNIINNFKRMRNVTESSEAYGVRL